MFPLGQFIDGGGGTATAARMAASDDLKMLMRQIGIRDGGDGGPRNRHHQLMIHELLLF